MSEGWLFDGDTATINSLNIVTDESTTLVADRVDQQARWNLPFLLAQARHIARTATTADHVRSDDPTADP